MPATAYGTPVPGINRMHSINSRLLNKLQAIEDAKQKLDDMQEEARKAGAPANMREP